MSEKSLLIKDLLIELGCVFLEYSDDTLYFRSIRDFRIVTCVSCSDDIYDNDYITINLTAEGTRISLSDYAFTSDSFNFSIKNFKHCYIDFELPFIKTLKVVF